MLFVGASPSAIRASIMMIMYYIAKTLLRQNDFYISFILSLFIILLINPYNIFSISMWLSFLGTLGIVLFSRIIQKLVQRKFKVKLDIIIVSISAQILIFPVMWKCFGTVSLNFWISNLLTSRVSSSDFNYWISFNNFIPSTKYYSVYRKYILEIFLKMVLISSRIPFNRFYLTIPSNFTIFIYYALIFALVCFYQKHRFTVFKWIFKKKYKQFLTKAFPIFLVFIVICQVIAFIPQDLRINFLDVRSG